MDKSTEMLWFILYDEEREKIPDPNKPENMVYHKAKKQERADKIKVFMNGPGAVLFNEWKKKVKQNQASMIAIPEKEMCNCTACLILRDTRKYLELLMEAERILSENKVV